MDRRKVDIRVRHLYEDHSNREYVDPDYIVRHFNYRLAILLIILILLSGYYIWDSGIYERYVESSLGDSKQVDLPISLDKRQMPITYYDSLNSGHIFTLHYFNKVHGSSGNHYVALISNDQYMPFKSLKAIVRFYDKSGNIVIRCVDIEPNVEPSGTFEMNFYPMNDDAVIAEMEYITAENE